MNALRWLGAALLLALSLVAFTPMVDRALRVSPPPPPGAGDAIVVLGSRMSVDGTLSAASLQRTIRGIQLYRRGLAPLLLMSGPRQGARVEAQVRADLAREFGVPESALLTDGSGHTTRDEARAIAERLRPRGVARVVLVTSIDHMPRARRQFEREGFAVEAAPVGMLRPEWMRPDERLGQARRWMEELAARIYYRAAAVVA
jgi:uncharacterized SAM-binding protein YcdF (DUF218 family)